MGNLRNTTVALLLAFCLSAIGCDRTINALTDTPDFRKGVVEKARTSCLTSANDAVKVQKTPAIQAEINNYCDCIATKGMATLSNADLVNIGVKGIHSVTPDQQAKMDAW